MREDHHFNDGFRFVATLILALGYKVAHLPVCCFIGLTQALLSVAKRSASFFGTLEFVVLFIGSDILFSVATVNYQPPIAIIAELTYPKTTN